MSRIAKKALTVPQGVEVSISGQSMKVKGSKGSFDFAVHDAVEVSQEDNVLKFKAKRDGDSAGWALAGTTRALANNMVIGVSQGFEKKLQLVGVGYRAQAQGNKLNLSLGFSHPVVHDMPEGITVETPSQTEILIRGSDKQKVGQVAAEVRAYRPPEPYKGKGVKYSDEVILRKETKKKK
jgi:large subunit ribosomal protein L6